MNRDERNIVLIDLETVEIDSEDRERLKELYGELGKAYYEDAPEEPLPQLLPIFDSITEILKKYERKTRICPQCGNELEEDARFCDECGTPVAESEDTIERDIEELVCKKCGNPLKSASKFCGACGAPVER